MDIYNYPLAPAKVTYKLLKSLTRTELECDKPQSSRLHQSRYRKSTIDPMTGEDLKDIKDNLYMIDANLTVCFATTTTRKSYQNLPTNQPNVRPPFPAANDDKHGG